MTSIWKIETFLRRQLALLYSFMLHLLFTRYVTPRHSSLQWAFLRSKYHFVRNVVACESTHWPLDTYY